MPILRCLSLTLVALACLAVGPCQGTPSFHFRAPFYRLLSSAGAPVEVVLKIPDFAPIEDLRISVGDARTLESDALTFVDDFAKASVEGLAPGGYALVAEAKLRVLFFRIPLRAATWFELVDLERPDTCDILNQAECLLPFPSARFLVPDATPTGVRVAYAEGVLPNLPTPLSSSAYGGQDGFSPMAQVVAHFPGRVDLAASGAPGLGFESRTVDARSLGSSSPTLILDADASLAPVLHFAEVDAKAAAVGAPERETVILRPLESLTPGHRYVVAFRNLVHADGSPVEAEPAFAALRDYRPSDIPALRERRADLKPVFADLAAYGVERSELVLAFDFVVQSDEGLTREMRAMRDRTFAWLNLRPGPGFEVHPFLPDPAIDADASVENDCSVEGEGIWRRVNGTFDVPLFLTSDPLQAPLTGGRIVDYDADGLPDALTTMKANFSFVIPCAAEAAAAPLPPIYTGHGLFSTGRRTVAIPALFDELSRDWGEEGFERVAFSTDWLGLSSFDFSAARPFPSFILNAVLLQPDEFGTLPDRLRQGMTNALALVRLVKLGHFNAHPAFQTADGAGVLPGPGAPVDYWGISLGGIMGTQLAALSPDLRRVGLDVPGANFSLLNPRSLAFGQFGAFLDLLNPDPLAQTLFFSLAEELWDSGEPGGYLQHVTGDPLPGSGAAKEVLMTVQRHDGIVANLASELSARSMRLSHLRDPAAPAGSAGGELVGIDDEAGPSHSGDPGLRGAVVVYDAGMYDVNDPLLLPFVPPLANEPAASNCDPHGRGFDTPAKVVQMTRWLRDGVIEDFCDGLCDALASDGGYSEFELPEGRSEPCDPLTEPPPVFGN